MIQRLPIFVYGTLKRGEVRASRWPHPPLRVEAATIQGVLKDLGPYPALLTGNGIVLGELWHLRYEHLEETLRVLDEIECYGNEDVDLYVRRVVDCVGENGEVQPAYTYFFADPRQIEDIAAITADSHGRIIWRGK